VTHTLSNLREWVTDLKWILRGFVVRLKRFFVPLIAMSRAYRVNKPNSWFALCSLKQ